MKQESNKLLTINSPFSLFRYAPQRKRTIDKASFGSFIFNLIEMNIFIFLTGKIVNFF